MTRAARFIAAGFACGLLAVPASAAWRGPVVVFSVDVESNEAFRLPDQVDAVCRDGAACGLMEIARLLQERRWSGTFFLNVYEHRRWGEAAMQRIAARLQGADQDVALHTHPQWAYDPTRWGMYQYSLDEQTAIVRDGVRLLQAWTGRPVVAHRAGAYAADEHTLQALERNGVLLDSSLFWQYPGSRLDRLGLPRNLPSQHRRVTEIPVTAYQRLDRPAIFSAAFAPVTVVRKIDPNWFINGDEARTAIDGAVGADVPVLVVFLHSFSFMAGTAGQAAPAGATADRHAIEMFRVILDHVASKHLPVVTMRELAERGLPALSSVNADIVPRVTVPVDLPHYAWRRIKASPGFSWPVGGGFTLLAVCAVLALTRGRRATKRNSTATETGAGVRSPASPGARSR